MDRDSGFGACRSRGSRLLEYLERNTFGVSAGSRGAFDGPDAFDGTLVTAANVPVDAHPVFERALRKWCIGFRCNATALRRGH